MRRPWVFAMGMLAAASLSCSLFNNVIPSSSLDDSRSAAPGASRSGSGTLVYQDDFEDSGTGWDRHAYEHGGVDYSDGKYWVSSDGDGHAIYGQANQWFGDVEVEVETQQSVGPTDDNNDYGVGCRVQDDGNGYFLLISGDGFVSIQIATDDGYSNLVDWEESSAVNLGNATNHLRAVCNGTGLDLYVNGEHVASANDDTYSSGDVALTATSYESDATQVYFDNLTVRQP